jgi:uncharacterized membrane protein
VLNLARPARRTDERGSVLFLLPAAALVVLVLASITVDLGLLHVRSRELWSIADAAANDAASGGLDLAALRATGTLRLDPVAAGDAAVAAVAASGVEGVEVAVVAVTADGREITVTLRREASLVIGRGLPGADTRVLTATATARLADGGP